MANLSRLKVLFIPTSNAGTTFYRFYNFWVAAHRQGIADIHVLWWRKDLHEVHPWESDILKSDYMWRITKELQDWAQVSDIIVFSMLHGSGMRGDGKNSYEQYINDSLGIVYALRDAFPGKIILSEIDDNMISTPEYNPAVDHYKPHNELRELAVRQFRETDGLIVSTPYLAEVYGELNSNINIIPNCIDFELWDRIKPKSKPGLKIGWAGGANHDDDLRVMEKVIPRIREKHPDIKFIFVHGCPHYLRNIPGVEYKPKFINIDKYPAYLKSMDFDIGVAPLVDNAFNRGKSNLRWLEYSAMGIPTVASNVGHFKETINHGVDGFLAEDENELVTYLDKLITDKKLRSKMGSSAYARIKKDFNVDTVCREYMDVLNGLRDSNIDRPQSMAVAIQ